MGELLDELKRRNVLRVGAAYLVVSWFILQFVEVVFPMLELDGDTIGRQILIVLLIGLPITLVLAWVFEITPSGIKLEKNIDRESDAHSSGRTLDRVVIVVLLVAVSLLLADRFLLDDANVQDDMRSVAVLPFVNMSADTETRFFADGLTESLLHMLAQVPELRVPARTSVFAFRDKQVDIREIASSLNVETVLEGSIRKSDDQLRITAQLIEAETGFHLWSKTFDKTMDDVFVVQDEIATSVADALAVTLTGTGIIGNEPGAGLTANTNAYELYLRALEQKHISSYSSLPMAEGLFKEALAADPSYMDAKIDLALTYQLQAETGIISSSDAFGRSVPLFEQVLDVDADNPRALAHMAIMDWKRSASFGGPQSPAALEALSTLEDAVVRSPNIPDLYDALSNAALISGRPDDALSWLEKGLEVDPLSARLHLAKGRILLNQLGRPEDAARAFATGREQAPEWTAVNFASGDAAFAMADYADGVRWYNRAMLMDPQDHELPGHIARFLYAFNLPDEAEVMLARAQAISPDAPWTRGIVLTRQMLSGNTERVAQLAASMLRDNIENRGEAFSIAVFSFVSAMIDLDRTDEIAPFLEELRPGITAADYEPRNQKDYSLRFAAMHALRAMDQDQDAREMAESTMLYSDATIPGWRASNLLMANIEIILGNDERAIDYIVADLSRPLSQNMFWRFSYMNVAWMRPFLDHPRVSPLIAELNAQSDQAAIEIMEMMGEKWPIQTAAVF